MIKHYAVRLLVILGLWCTLPYATPVCASTPETASKEKAKALKKQIKNVREALKNKKGNDALKGVDEIRKDSAELWNAQVLQYGVDACKIIADAENEKLYLKNNPDTTAFFNAIYNICHHVLLTDTAEQFKAFADSMEGRKPRFKYRRTNTETLAKNMGNMLTAPRYFTAKAKWEEAKRFADMDIKLVALPWMAQKAMADSVQMVQLATMYTNACYNLKDYAGIERHAALALKDSVAHENLLERIIYAEAERGDSTRYLKNLEEGHRRYPINPFFFCRLMESLIQSSNFDGMISHANYTLSTINAMGLTDSTASDSTLAAHHVTHKLVSQCHEAISIAYYHQEKYRDCIEAARKALCWDPAHPCADFFIGASYYQMAMQVKIPSSIHDPSYQQNYKERNRLLEMARPYMETYRKNNPDDARFWANILYDIYLYLNLGPEFEEIERAMP